MSDTLPPWVTRETVVPLYCIKQRVFHRLQDVLSSENGRTIPFSNNILFYSVLQSLNYNSFLTLRTNLQNRLTAKVSEGDLSHLDEKNMKTKQFHFLKFWQSKTYLHLKVLYDGVIKSLNQAHPSPMQRKA